MTGRLRVQNIDKLICKAAASDNDCLVNLHSRAKYADTRVIVSSGAFWEYVMRLVDTIDDAKHRYLEHIVPLAIHAATRAGLKCDYLLPPPMITGRSASTAHIYTASMTAHALTYFKILLKRVIYHQHRL